MHLTRARSANFQRELGSTPKNDPEKSPNDRAACAPQKFLTAEHRHHPARISPLPNRHDFPSRKRR